MKRKILYGALALIIVPGVIWKLKSKDQPEATLKFDTTIVNRGNINDIIMATGTLEALETVEVGTQVSGVIEKLYVDYNFHVKKGQLLAHIDETPLKATLEQSKASVDNAQAELVYQEASYNRTKALFEKKLIAQTDYDLALYNYQKAKASLSSAMSNHSKNEINLAYARIYSPIDGIVLDRAVEAGQTVAASFNTPTLFTIVNDLTQMQVEASIDEADIGKLREGQRVEFSVDAYPDKTYEGTVTQIRLQPIVTSNVVTYIVIVDAPNPDKTLMPGMTANVSIYVTEKKNIVVVPATAVNLTVIPDLWDELKTIHPELTVEMPRPPEMSEGRDTNKAPIKGEGNVQAPFLSNGNMPQMKQMPKLPNDMKIIWTKNGNTIKPKMVKLGETDEIIYEVISGLIEGEEVVTTLQKSAMTMDISRTNARSPFMPTPPGQRNR